MCIVCDIKQVVESFGLNKEARAKILGLIETLAGAMEDVLDVAQEIHEAAPEAFQLEHIARLRNAAALLTDQTDRGELPDALLALLLAALRRGGKVETIRVELREGETPEQAVARAMGEHKARASTKH